MLNRWESFVILRKSVKCSHIDCDARKNSLKSPYYKCKPPQSRAPAYLRTQCEARGCLRPCVRRSAGRGGGATVAAPVSAAAQLPVGSARGETGLLCDA